MLLELVVLKLGTFFNISNHDNEAHYCGVHIGQARERHGNMDPLDFRNWMLVQEFGFFRTLLGLHRFQYMEALVESINLYKEQSER